MQRAASIEDQARNCQKRADAEGWEVVATFADAAITGSDNSRPQYRAMLAAAERREFEILLLDDLSRLARDSVEQETIIRRLEFHGLRIIATSDGYDSESKARKVHRGFKGLMNEIFLDDLREKTHRGLSGQALKCQRSLRFPHLRSLKIPHPSRGLNLTSVTTASGQTVTYGYNGNHQVTSVSVNGATVLSGVTYKPWGR